MKNPATTIVIFNCQLQRPGRLALVKGEGTVRDNLRRVEGHEPLTSILSPSKMGEAAVYQVDDDWSPRAQIQGGQAAVLLTSALSVKLRGSDAPLRRSRCGDRSTIHRHQLRAWRRSWPNSWYRAEPWLMCRPWG